MRFSVEPCHSSIVMLTGPVSADDSMTLWRNIGCPDCEMIFEEVRTDGVPVTLNLDNNPVVITLPGAYEFRWVGETPDDVRVCTQVYARTCQAG